MFTGFASENTPAIQVWDFFRAFASTAASRLVSLPDDCAPIQVFRTGATGSSAIRVYLPTAPIEGKQITIVNQYYGINAQKVEIYSSDTTGNGSSSNALFTLGSADSLILVYSKQNITIGTGSGIAQTGWFALNKGSPTAVSYYSSVVGGNNNAAPSSYSFIGGGTNNLASGGFAAIVGGQSNTASSPQSAILGGLSNTANGNNCIVAGGSSNLANSPFSAIVGGVFGTARGVNCNLVLPASNTPIAAAYGICQSATLLLGRQTTDATATVLCSDASAAGTTNQVILPNNSAYTFQGTCIANVTGGGTTSGWQFEGVIKRGANAASTALVAAVTPLVIAQDAGAVTWVLAVTADTTNGGIAVTVTGAAATTIRWVAKIETTEVAF
jgi:hypothetical protein